MKADRSAMPDATREELDLVYAEAFTAEHQMLSEQPADEVTGIDDFPIGGTLDEITGFERSVCGAFFYHPAEMIEQWRILTAGIHEPGKAVITRERHRAFIRRILAMIKAGLPIDPISFHKHSTLEERDACGGMGYVCEHGRYYFSLQSSRHHLSLLVDDYRRRALIEVTEKVAGKVAVGADVNAAIAELAEKTKSLLRSNNTMQSMDYNTVADIMESLIKPEAVTTVPSFFRAVAETAGDYQRGQISLIGGPSGTGKTAHAMQEIEHFLGKGLVVDAFLMESSQEQFVSRALSRRRLIHGRRIINRSFTQDDTRAMFSEIEELAKFENQLYMAPRALYSALDIAAMVQERKQRTGQPCDAIVVDYLGRMKACNPKHSATEYDAIHENVAHLWNLAAQENAALILYSQLTMEAVRHSFHGSSKVPSIGAFKGGAPTEAAKMALILYKDEQDMLAGPQVVEQKLVICKANDGGTGVVHSLFLKPYAMHIEDTCDHDRTPYAAHLRSLGFELHQLRKDGRK